MAQNVSLFLQQENERLESVGWEVAGPEGGHEVIKVLPDLAAGHNHCPLRPVAHQLLLAYVISALRGIVVWLGLCNQESSDHVTSILACAHITVFLYLPPFLYELLGNTYLCANLLL